MTLHKPLSLSMLSNKYLLVSRSGAGLSLLEEPIGDARGRTPGTVERGESLPRTSGNAAGRPAGPRSMRSGGPARGRHIRGSRAGAVAMAAGSRRARGRARRLRAAGRSAEPRSPGAGQRRPQRRGAAGQRRRHVAGERGSGLGDGKRARGRAGRSLPSARRVGRPRSGPDEGGARPAAAGDSCHYCYRITAALQPPPACGRPGVAAPRARPPLHRPPLPGSLPGGCALASTPATPARPGVCGARDRGPPGGGARCVSARPTRASAAGAVPESGPRATDRATGPSIPGVREVAPGSGNRAPPTTGQGRLPRGGAAQADALGPRQGDRSALSSVAGDVCVN